MKNYLLFLFLFFFAGAKAQEITINISADNADIADSLTVVAKDMIGELKKAGSFEFRFEKSGNSKNRNSISFILRSQSDEAGVNYPKALKSFNPEGYYIKSGADHIDFIGNSALALQHAIFDYLEQLGYRYYLPGETWQIIPSVSSPFIAYEKLTQPFYEFRSLANGHGFYRNKKVENDFNFWAKANQLGGSFPIRVGHSYQTIVSNNAEVFKQHPEYFAGDVAKGTLPVTGKFNVSNKQLVELVVNDAKQRLSVFKKTGQFMNMVSMEPSDGGGFCTSPECMKIGNSSDQVFYLTNTVARAVQREYPGIWVGNLAYNEHIEPTKYDLEPNVFVMVTNGFNHTKYSTNELLEKWNKKAKKVGVYEYLSVFAWDYDLPGKPNAVHLDYLKKSIKGYYESGARVYLAETNIGWASKGLGQYIASKLLWDYRLNVDSLAEDFYSKSFGRAAPVMKQLYKSWESNPGGFISDNALAEWLGWVDEADQIVSDKRIKERLDYIKIYLHYLVLYKKLKTNSTKENLDKVLNFAYRTFDVSAFSTVAIMTALPVYSGFKGYGLYDTKEHSWMQNANPLSPKELKSIFQDDLRSIKKVEGMKSFRYGNKFKKAKKIQVSPKMKPGNTAPSFIGETNFLIRIDKRSKDNYLEIKSGYSARPDDAKPVTVKIYKYSQYQVMKDDAEVIISMEQSEKLVNKKMGLQKLEKGDYIVRVQDQYKMFVMKFSDPIAFSVMMNPEKTLLTSSVTGLNTFYFSVQAPSKKFVIHKSKILKLLSPTGRLLEYLDNNQESIVVDVKENETGLWQIFYQSGGLHIEGVPPYLGVIPEKMLLPSDPD
ncbi:MAG: DUF4838 domain-containing protein [Chitinophagaceae bacterium]